MKTFLTLFAMLVATTLTAQQQPYWNMVPSGTTKKLLSISFGDTATGYIGGMDSLMLKTIDGGLTWHPVPLTGISMGVGENDVVDVDFLSATTGYITITNHNFPYLLGSVYKTVNGGSSWTLVDAGNTAAYRTHFLSEGNGFVIGSAFFAGNVVSKLNGGTPADYHAFSNEPTVFNLCIDFYDAQTGIIGDGEGKIYRTFDGGVHWDTVSATGTDTAIYAIRFLNDSTILAATVGVLIISTDHGLTWQTDFNSLTFDYPIAKAIVLSAKDSFVAAGTSITTPEKGIIYWHDHVANRRELTDQPLFDVAACTDSVTYAVGDSGLIVTNRTAPVVGIHTPSLLEKQLKIYPNPTSGICTTTLPVTHTVKVYDISGRLILTKNKPALKQSLNLSAYASGTYYLNIETGEGKINRKLVLQR